MRFVLGLGVAITMRASIVAVLAVPVIACGNSGHVVQVPQDPIPTYDWYVDSVHGSDSNSGTLPTQALRTLSALLAKPVQQGQAVGLARGSYWREMLHVGFGGLPNGVQLEAYGPRVAAPTDDLGRSLRDGIGGVDDRPRVSAANVIPSGCWAKTIGRTNVYQCALDTSVVPSNWAGMGMRIWEDWQGYGPVGRLTWVADVATVDATPGSWTGPTRPTHGLDTIYLHASDSGNPATNGKNYEWPARPWGVNAGQYPTDATKLASVRGISVDRHGHHDGGLLTATYLADFSVDTGGAGTVDPSHGLWCNGTCEDGVASSVISYGNNLPPTAYRRIRVACSAPLQGVTAVNGFYFHTDGIAGHEHEKKTYEDVVGPTAGSGFTCSNLIAGGSATQVAIIRPRANENTVMTLIAVGTIGRLDVVDPLHIRYGFGHGSIAGIAVSSNTVANVWGGRFVYDAAAPYGLIRAESGSTLSVTGTSLVAVGNEPGYRLGIASTVTGGTINVTRCAMHTTFEAINASAATQGTINHNAYTTSVNSWRHNGAQSTTFAAWQSRGYDANSAEVDWTLAGDPLTGDTRPVAGSAPYTIGAGADAYGDEHIAEWIAAIP